MTKELIFTLISTCLIIGWNIPYIFDVWKWRSFPHPISFWVWSILTGFNTYVLFISGEYLGFISGWAIFLTTFILAILGVIHYKKIYINWFDYICLFLIIGLLFYWIFSRNVINTVILTTLIDMIAFLPTFKKGWLRPWSETAIAYFIPWVTQIFTILSIQTPNIETTLFWWYLLFANLTFVTMVISRRNYLKWWNSIFE